MLGQAFAGGVVVEPDDLPLDLGDVAALLLTQLNAASEGLGEHLLEREFAQVMENAAEKGLLRTHAKTGALVFLGQQFGAAGDRQRMAPERGAIEGRRGVGFGFDEAVHLDRQHRGPHRFQTDEDDGPVDRRDLVRCGAIGATTKPEHPCRQRRVGLDELDDLLDVGIGRRGELQDAQRDRRERGQRLDVAEDELAIVCRGLRVMHARPPAWAGGVSSWRGSRAASRSVGATG